MRHPSSFLRSIFRVGGLGALALSLASCGDGDVEPFVDFQYSTRCEETRGCEGERQRDVCGVNNGEVCDELGGTAPFQVTCSVEEVEGTRNVNLTAVGAGFSFRISQLRVDAAGGPGGGANCAVAVTDGPNRYRGRCGSSPPSEAQPCQIPAVMFQLNEGTPEVTGSVLCRNLENETNPTLELELSSFGSGPTAEMTPASFRFANCDGLELEE